MNEMSDAVVPAPVTPRRGWRFKSAIAAVGVATAAFSMAVALPANAAVSATGANARFVHLINNCGDGFTRRNMSYYVQGTYKSSGAVWHTWQGSLNCNPVVEFKRVIFAWEPASTTSRLNITIYINNSRRDVVIDADTNYCFIVTTTGRQVANTSKAGGGGSGACTVR